MNLIIASNNAHKIREIKSILGAKFENIRSLREASIDHETIEDGETFLDNAIKKAKEICELSGMPALADDSGLCVNSLGGAPGVFSARYSGEGATDEKNNALLLENMKDKSDRSAYFICTVAIAFPNGDIITAEGRVEGEILDSPRGSHGFGYDPLFLVLGDTRTLSEMTDDEKNSISHRNAALKNLIKNL